ncbi:MAG: hypothetical protein V4692_12880 [Bdellovibrionota bacterium]
MNKLILILATIFAIPAFAEEASTVSSFECEAEKTPGIVFKFKMSNLGKEDMDFLNADPEDDYSAVFTTDSDEIQTNSIVNTLNGQGGDLRTSEDRIVFFGDSAGIDFAYLNLFKDSGYTKGYVRTEFNFGEEKDYSKVSCTVNTSEVTEETK